jgi:predicted RNase H-like nuclease
MGRARGGICSIAFDGEHFNDFRAPELVGFDRALSFIESVRRDNTATIIALDQPTIVPNQTGMRPVERVADNLMRWLGGGVIPANRDNKMFGDGAPIWRFLQRLNAIEGPELARTDQIELYLIEVYPALALPSLDERFFGFRKRPCYNPDRPKFRIEDWKAVVAAALRQANRCKCQSLVDCLDEIAALPSPKKADQDRLDSIICLLIAVRWRLGSRQESVVIGDLKNGYMVAPVSAAVRERLSWASESYGVPIDYC